MSGARSSGWWILVPGLALAAAGCPAGPGGDERAPVVLETEEIGPGLDEDLDLSSDRKGAPRGAAGQLPGGFPEDLPIYKPSSISDLGQGEQGNFVQFMSPDRAAKVRAWYPTALASAGWSVESGPGGSLTVNRAGRSARVSIQDADPVTFIRVEF